MFASTRCFGVFTVRPMCDWKEGQTACGIILFTTQSPSSIWSPSDSEETKMLLQSVSVLTSTVLQNRDCNFANWRYEFRLNETYTKIIYVNTIVHLHNTSCSIRKFQYLSKPNYKPFTKVTEREVLILRHSATFLLIMIIILLILIKFSLKKY